MRAAAGASLSHQGSLRASETVTVGGWDPSSLFSEGSVRVEGAMVRSLSETAVRLGTCIWTVFRLEDGPRWGRRLVMHVQAGWCGQRE